ncbi:hypothetical protein RD1_3239 [Roseobacter denitrificans OCh 114]|uniref:Uncharacterized protein n=1 Tax=Roseobacter denitrificans (strain ATCC 33942 / OCh 114) TaxID=375451 RepID=Q163V2_ROSDO|nr:hypothetical protein RD1_3239 [Roseobacter denitrificans OCh 114]
MPGLDAEATYSGYKSFNRQFPAEVAPHLCPKA